MSFNITALPDYLDTVVFQASAFYKNNSNLLDIFEDYLTELNLNLDYEKGKSSGDILENNVNFFKKLNDTYELFDKLDDIINKNSDNGLLKKQLLCLTEDLSKYKDVDVKNIKIEKK